MSMQEPPAELVQEMYAYYQTGKSLADVGRKYHYTAPGVGKMFRRYGLPIRPKNEALILYSANRRYGRDKTT